MNKLCLKVYKLCLKEYRTYTVELKNQQHKTVNCLRHNFQSTIFAFIDLVPQVCKS